jgi:arginyl-tRNA--protein-N-Asp/Glu arginylyltransferase
MSVSSSLSDPVSLLQPVFLCDEALSMIVLDRFIEGPSPCIYLPDRLSRIENELVANLTPEAYEQRMNAGWRKFGICLFRPVCDGCAECRPLRVLVDRFQPDRSQRRALKRNADLEIRCTQPTVDAARLRLWERYHTAQTLQKGWPVLQTTAEEYAFNFVLNPLPTVEITLYEGGVLRAVVLTDVVPGGVSGIYHYHDPECRERSLGTFALLQVIALAKQLGKPYAYFGYYVAGCGSMAYKSRFRPCEILGPDGAWREMQRGDASNEDGVEHGP